MADRVPQRIQLRRTKGWRLPAGAVNVARPTIYGNPFTADTNEAAVEAVRTLTKGGTKSWDLGVNGLALAKNRHPDSLHWSWADWLRDEGLPALRGKDLACWCKPGEACHADVLLELANWEQS